MLIKVKMTIVVGFLTFMRMRSFMLSLVEHDFFDKFKVSQDENKHVMSGLVWVQSVWQSDVPKDLLTKKLIKKKSA